MLVVETGRSVFFFALSLNKSNSKYLDISMHFMLTVKISKTLKKYEFSINTIDTLQHTGYSQIKLKLMQN